MRSHMTTTFTDAEEECIGVGSGDHVAGSIGDAIIWLGGNITKELIDSQRRSFRGGYLLDANRADDDHELAVHVRA